ncbi:hypothetical protein COO60DRAFT_1634883 [Scenedesmus sp. NREL 46B-D3]|nr:hypothetical protein COO60DRAFT_1634883 [Scenedesmus sp. NREL 46B-D3]
MESSAVAVLARTAECAALLFIGYNLRLPPLTWHALLGGPVVLAASAAAAGFSWLRFKQRHARERALLCGSAVGSDAAAIAVPFVETLAGPAGVAAACSAVVANALAVCVGSYLLTGSAGPAFPESYKHDDGGSYRGEWRGLSKEGLGAYTYQSGARYEGEWRNNLKDGRGVYYFPRCAGGTYEGEWAGGVMAGTGLRTYSSGRVVAGRWEAGRLAAPLELWQCAAAAEGAAEAALAARRVVVGGGKPSDALQLLVVQPVLWAALLGLGLNVLRLPLPGSIAVVAAALAPANKALMLLSAGMLLQPALPQPRQVSDVTAVAAARTAAALFCVANALVLLPGCGHPLGRLSVLAAAAVLLSPVPPLALEFTRNFRLNEALSGACRDASLLAAAPLLLLLALGVGALGLLPVALPGPAQPLELGLLLQDAAAADASGSASMLAAIMVMLAAAIILSAGYITEKFAPEKSVKMRYAGSGAPAAVGEAGSSGAAGGSAVVAAAAAAAAAGCSLAGIGSGSTSCRCWYRM